MTRAWRLPLGILAGFALAALLAPLLAPYDPIAQLDPLGRALQPPSAAHWLGTDPYSRDVLSRLLYGARASLGIATLAVAVALSLGTLVGAAAAVRGGIVDTLLMRLTDAMLAIPRLLLLLLVVAASGPLPAAALAAVLGATGWMTAARLVRQETRRLMFHRFRRGRVRQRVKIVDIQLIHTSRSVGVVLLGYAPTVA